MSADLHTRYCRCGRRVMTNTTFCGVCHNQTVMRDWRYVAPRHISAGRSCELCGHAGRRNRYGLCSVCMAFCERFDLLRYFTARPAGRPRREAAEVTI